MDIHTAAHYMKSGYRIRRANWGPGNWISKELIVHTPIHFVFNDLLADDWEIITEGIIKHFPVTYSDEGEE